MPSDPPSSPLTGSYLTTCAFYDPQFGPDREPIGTCPLDPVEPARTGARREPPRPEYVPNSKLFSRSTLASFADFFWNGALDPRRRSVCMGRDKAIPMERGQGAKPLES
jgi:hypothetical protein